MPAVSAAASWMDTFKMSMREIRKKHTKSELLIMTWDSRQRAFNMRAPPKQNNQTGQRTIPAQVSRNGIRETADGYEMPDHLNNGVSIPKKFFSDDGEIDLRQSTGPEAVKYLQAVGINIAMRF